MSDSPKTEAPVRTLYQTVEFQKEFGTVRIEEWPEGIVLWVGGEIRWRSWKDLSFAHTRLEARRAVAAEMQAIMTIVNAEPSAPA